jgi:hypothetical protein
VILVDDNIKPRERPEWNPLKELNEEIAWDQALGVECFV